MDEQKFFSYVKSSLAKYACATEQKEKCIWYGKYTIYVEPGFGAGIWNRKTRNYCGAKGLIFKIRGENDGRYLYFPGSKGKYVDMDYLDRIFSLSRELEVVADLKIKEREEGLKYEKDKRNALFEMLGDKA